MRVECTRNLNVEYLPPKLGKAKFFGAELFLEEIQ
jgi:hypothetical protein